MITNVFEHFADELVPPFSSEDELRVVGDLCGVLIPTKEEHDFPGIVDTQPRVVAALSAPSKRGEVFLIWVQSTWFPATRTNRHLGPTKDLRDCHALANSLIGQKCLINDEGQIRHLGVCSVSQDALSEAVIFAAENQRRSFLVVSRSLDHEAILESAEGGLVRASEKRAVEEFVYPRVCRGVSDLDGIVVRSIGWLEDGCEFRFLCIGAPEPLQHCEEAT